MAQTQRTFRTEHMHARPYLGDPLAARIDRERSFYAGSRDLDATGVIRVIKKVDFRYTSSQCVAHALAPSTHFRNL